MTRGAALKGVQFLVDEKGEKTGILIDLKENAELWEDLYDRASRAGARRNRANPSMR